MDGYYVRIAPADVGDQAAGAPAARSRSAIVRLATSARAYEEIVSLDALALVRFGLRDPTIRAS